VTDATTLTTSVRPPGWPSWSGATTGAGRRTPSVRSRSCWGAAGADAAVGVRRPGPGGGGVGQRRPRALRAALAGPGWEPLVARGRLTTVEDGDGSPYANQLLDQELRKHPPARALLGSPLLRREHWWGLPRLVLLLDPVSVAPVAPRTGPLDAVLAVDDGGLHVATVPVATWDADAVVLDSSPTDAGGPAALVGQEVSVPDAERWTVHVTTGRYDGGRLHQATTAASRPLEPVPGLLGRVRQQHALERACVRALRRDGHT